MRGYTKEVNGYWETRTFKPDNTWLKIEKDAYDVVVFPVGLALQAENELLENNKLRLQIEKLNDIEMLSTTVNTVEYDGHTRARSDLTGVTALANFRFNQLVVTKLGEGKNIVTAMQEAYQEVYKQTTTWLGKDNTPHEVQYESIAEAGIKVYDGYAELLGVK